MIMMMKKNQTWMVTNMQMMMKRNLLMAAQDAQAMARKVASDPGPTSHLRTKAFAPFQSTFFVSSSHDLVY